MDTWFLVLSLFLPRIALLIAWLGGNIPANNIPFLGEFFMTLLMPRILMLIYIGTTLGTGSAWFIVHLLVLIFIWVGMIIRSEMRSE